MGSRDKLKKEEIKELVKLDNPTVDRLKNLIENINIANPITPSMSLLDKLSSFALASSNSTQGGNWLESITQGGVALNNINQSDNLQRNKTLKDNINTALNLMQYEDNQALTNRRYQDARHDAQRNYDLSVKRYNQDRLDEDRRYNLSKESLGLRERTSATKLPRLDVSKIYDNSNVNNPINNVDSVSNKFPTEYKVIEDLANYRTSFKDVTKNMPYGEQAKLQELVKAINPDWNKNAYDNTAVARKNYFNPTTGGASSTVAINTASNHINEIDNYLNDYAVKGIDQTGYINQAYDFLRSVGNLPEGAPDLAQLQTGLTAVVNEVERVLVGGKPTVSGIKKLSQSLGVNKSIAENRASLNALKELMAGRLNSIARHRNSIYLGNYSVNDFAPNVVSMMVEKGYFKLSDDGKHIIPTDKKEDKSLAKNVLGEEVYNEINKIDKKEGGVVSQTPKFTIRVKGVH